MNLNLIYWDNIIILSVVVIIYFTDLNVKRQFDTETKLFIGFVVTITLPIIIYQVDYIRDVAKYSIYFFIYLMIFKVYIVNKKYYNIFINFMLIYLAISFTVYFFDIVLGFHFYNYFDINNIYLPTDHSLLIHDDYSYYFPYYLYVIPKLFTVQELNIFGFFRFYGFSYEPTFFSMILLPLVFISLDLKRYLSAAVFSVFIFIVSSYAAIAIWILFILIYFSFHLKQFRYISMGLIFYLIASYYSEIFNYLIISPVMQNRLVSYSAKLDLSFLFSFVSNKHIADNPYAASTASIITNSLRYGIINTISFLFIAYYFIKKAYKIDYNKLTIVLVILMYSQKSPYYFTPLILFYLNYLNVKWNDPE